MKNKLLLFTLSITALISCTSTYRSGQTPDDVYYSPARYEEDEDDNDEDSTHRYQGTDDQVRTRDYDYHSNPFRYGYTRYNYYNPFFCPYPVYIPTKTTPVRSVNLSAYNTPVLIKNPKTGTTTMVAPSRAYNNSNRGSAVREIFSGGSGTPRTYSPSSSGSSGSSSGSRSGGTPVSRPSKN